MGDMEKLDGNLDQISAKLDEMDAMLESLYDEQNIDKLAESISLGQYAELSNTLAYHSSSLYYLFLKVNGLPIKDHKINEELTRVKTYMQKVRAASEQKKVSEVKPKNPNVINFEGFSRELQQVESHNKRVMEQQAKDWKEAQDKMELEQGSFAATTKQSQQKKLHRGALIPTAGHLNWKDQINDLLK